METTNTAIDWEKCRRSLITSDVIDLPANIRPVQAEQLDANAVANALGLLGGSVTSTTINVRNGCPELIGFPHGYIEANGRFAFETPPSESYNDTNFLLRQEFGKRIYGVKDQTQKALLDVWQSGISAMICAAAKVWPRSLHSLEINGMGRFDQSVTHSFHRHGGLIDAHNTGRILPGFFLNYTPSYVGTMFPDAGGDLWYSPGGSYSLFTTDGHPHVDGCDHSTPDQYLSPVSGEKRATAILKVFPIPEI